MQGRKPEFQGPGLFFNSSWLLQGQTHPLRSSVPSKSKSPITDLAFTRPQHVHTEPWKVGATPFKFGSSCKLDVFKNQDILAVLLSQNLCNKGKQTEKMSKNERDLFLDSPES